MKTDQKPPLGRSPLGLRIRQPLQPSNIINPLVTPTAIMTKPTTNNSEIRPEYQTMSCELSALSKMVQDELGAMNAKNYSSENFGSAFERGRFYEEYIARRNERLRKKQRDQSSEVDEPKTACNLGVKVESVKKKEYKKKAESLKKSVAATYTMDRSQHPRYALRSTVKKPPLPVPMAMNVDEKMTTRKCAAASRSRRK